MKYITELYTRNRKVLSQPFPEYKEAEKKANEWRRYNNEVLPLVPEEKPRVKITLIKTGYIVYDKPVFQKYLKNNEPFHYQNYLKK